MKLKKNNHLVRRLIVSFGTLGLFFISVVIAFTKIQDGPQIGGTPTLVRYSFMWNEKVWNLVRSSRRLSGKKPVPPTGTSPRVNGMIGLRSELDIKEYKVQVESGETKLVLPVSAFTILTKSSYSTDFRCIEGWSEELQYAGVKFSVFMDEYKLGRKKDGSYYNYVGLETLDGEYYVSIDMESMLHEQTLIAYELNERPMSLENGFPLRLLIPIKYGIKSLKRIGKIYFSDSRPPDYWAERGYDWYSGL